MFAGVLLAALIGVPAGQEKKMAQVKEPPAKTELLSNEDSYRNQKDQEQEFVGRFIKVGGKPGAKGAVSPFELTQTFTDMIEISKQIEEKVGGEIRKVTVTEVFPVTKEARWVVDAGVRNELLEPFVGKTVKVTGKLVLTKGPNHVPELWPARIELSEEQVPPLVKPAPAVKKLATVVFNENQDMKLKIHAKAAWPYASDNDKKGKQLVLRSAADVVANSPHALSSADPRITEKKATEELARAFKVQSIDWTKQMVIVVAAGTKPTGGYQIDVQSVTVSGKDATVKWKLDPPMGIAIQVLTNPAVMVLVDRVDGQVKFDPAIK